MNKNNTRLLVFLLLTLFISNCGTPSNKDEAKEAPEQQEEFAQRQLRQIDSMESYLDSADSYFTLADMHKKRYDQSKQRSCLDSFKIMNDRARVYTLRTEEIFERTTGMKYEEFRAKANKH